MVSPISRASSVQTQYPVDPVPKLRPVKRQLPLEQDTIAPAPTQKKQRLHADDKLYSAPEPDTLTIVPPLNIEAPITDADREEFEELVHKFKAIAGPDFERMMAELFKAAVEIQEEDIDLNVELLKLAHKFSLSLSEEKQKAMEQLAAEVARSALFQKLQFAAGALGLVGLGVAASTATGPVGIVFALSALVIVGAATIDSMAGDPAKRFIAEQIIARAVVKAFNTDDTKTKEWSLFGLTLGVTATAAVVSLGAGLLTITGSASTLFLAVNVVTSLVRGTTQAGNALNEIGKEQTQGNLTRLSGESTLLDHKRKKLTSGFGRKVDEVSQLYGQRRSQSDQANQTTKAICQQA